jgi:hypothetical protein
VGAEVDRRRKIGRREIKRGKTEKLGLTKNISNITW